MTLSKQQDMVYPMIGQVGGTGCNKKPILTLLPDYVLKPLLYDHRGIREIAFYEAIRIITQSPAHHVHHTYSTFLTGREQPSKSHIIVASTNTASSSSSSSSFWSILRSSIAITRDYTDTIAMAIAIFVQDPLVLQSERALRDTWRSIQREIDMIRQLQKFTPPYYGVIMMNHMHHCSSSSNDNNNHNIYNDKDSSRHDTVSVNKISSSSCSSNGTTGTHHHIVDPTMLYGTSFDDAHLLLQDLTINYSKPCVMDLKMGVQTYVRFV
jgi:Inositol polyphosphate kinase